MWRQKILAPSVVRWFLSRSESRLLTMPREDFPGSYYLHVIHSIRTSYIHNDALDSVHCTLSIMHSLVVTYWPTSFTPLTLWPSNDSTTHPHPIRIFPQASHYTRYRLWFPDIDFAYLDEYYSCKWPTSLWSCGSISMDGNCRHISDRIVLMP